LENLCAGRCVDLMLGGNGGKKKFTFKRTRQKICTPSKGREYILEVPHGRPSGAEGGSYGRPNMEHPTHRGVRQGLDKLYSPRLRVSPQKEGVRKKGTDRSQWVTKGRPIRSKMGVCVGNRGVERDEDLEKPETTTFFSPFKGARMAGRL